MVNVVPFLPSFSWTAEWISALRNGVSGNEAVIVGNNTLSLKGKDFARTSIREREGERILSVPIVGGSASLKRMSNIPSSLLSDHGNWRHNHLGAFEAEYGRTPFFGDIFPLLKECYDGQTDSLAVFNESLFKALQTVLIPSSPFPEELPAAARERGLELTAEINPGLSVLDFLMRLGPETLLPLLVWNEK